MQISDSLVLVTGGSGLVGGEVILSLARRGHHVRAVVRGVSPEAARARLLTRLRKSASYRLSLEPLIDVVTGDTSLPLFGVQPIELAGVRAIVHCAANTQFSTREDEHVWQTNVGGARHLVDLAESYTPSARVVFVSTAAVITAPEGRVVHEDMPYEGYDNAYTRSKREAERIVTSHGLDVVVVRPSIVLSRGIADRELARSILWAVPIMNQLGDVPVNPDAHIDLVPVDHVANAIAAIAVKPTVKHRLLHISSGQRAETFAEVIGAVSRSHPEFSGIRALGRDARPSKARARLMRPMKTYLPFINMDVRYATSRLEEEVADIAPPAAAHTYVPDLIGQITMDEALVEMYRP